jgi:hypothetical protein
MQNINNEFQCYKNIKPLNKVLKILILGGGPTGLFAGYKLLKKGNDITIFEKRKKYTRHNILSLQETTRLDTLSLIPSEIMDELNKDSSFSHINANIEKNNKKCYKNILKEKPYLMASSRVYYIVLNELETAYEKYFNMYGGNLIKPTIAESFNDIRIDGNLLKYTENNNTNTIDISTFDIIFINDGANSLYRNIYFEKTSYTENIENNILRYGLTENNNGIKITNNILDIKPLAYGLILLYNIENKEEFQKNFRSEGKLEKKIDFDSVLELNSNNNNFIDGITIKEILIENNNKPNNKNQPKLQNIFRMFISENYLYISIMVNPKDVNDFAQKIQNQNLLFDRLPANIQIYITFALYYYDLSELIDLQSNNIIIKLFPLTFSCVKQSCSFIKKNGTTPNTNPLQSNPLQSNPLQRNNSLFGITIDKYFPKNKLMDGECPIIPKNYYQFVSLCGDAMASGNFHAGIVLNRNLVAINHLCQLIEEYIDAYPKDINNNLNNNFLRLMFFHGNLLNQKARNEIITKSIDNLINFHALDNDVSVFNLSHILSEMKEDILCKNCSDKNKLMCKNSAAFVKFMVDNSNNEVMQRILKYLFLPNKYKYNELLENIFNIEATETTFE